MPPLLTITPPPARLFEEVVGKWTAQLIAAAAAALREEHELAMTAAKADTPVQYGVLRASGTVFPTVVTATRLVSPGGFGGAAKEYAVYVHENLTARHRVGHAKFYENALLARARGMDRRLRDGIDRRMR